MNRPPIKIIHKYKNSNNHVGYKVYIFLGNVADEIKDIINKFKELSFQDTILKLSRDEFETLGRTYGSVSWYYFFFNKYHISRSKSILRKKTDVIAILQKKLGEKWITTHLGKVESVLRPVYADRYADYIHNLLKNRKTTQIGGNEADDNINVDEEEELLFDSVETTNENTLDDLDSEINLDHVNVDENTLKTQQEIKNIVSKKTTDYYEFKDDPFEVEQDNQDLINVYSKEYIFHNFIFYDDSIYKIKTKICDSVRLHDRFENNYLLPSRLYLWTEYYTKDMIVDKLMVGSKWIKKSELWNLDIEPKNDINAYVNLESKSLQDLNYAYKKYSNRIKRDDDDQVILHEYIEYISNYELYLTDIYTQLNTNFQVEENKLSNLINTFVRIYFPTIVLDIQDIMAYLQKDSSVGKNNEIKKMEALHKSLKNDLLMEREIIDLVEKTDIKSPSMFSTPYIIQSVVHLDLRLDNYESLNLRKIFDNFLLEDKYPFVQLQLSHEKPIRKILKNSYYDTVEETKEKANYLKNWLKSNTFGITIKIQAGSDSNNRFLTITMSDSGRIQYKIQWKEENKTTIDQIATTFKYIEDLITKFNSENDLEIPLPKKHQYKYVFINSMQQFHFTSEFKKINHNDLSDFARLFFPYVAVVIEPKKRIAKEKKQNASKWGTYLRFKCVSNYEDETKIGKRIVYYLKNYEIDEVMLVKVIENEFNITEKEAKKTIQDVTNKYPIYKRKGKVLKKLDTITPYKPSGVAIEIQGKTPDNYKIKVIGSRNEYQMNEITNFISKLLFLYQETYLEKKANRQNLLEKLEKLSNIAKRRNFVRDIIQKDETDSYHAIKKMKNIDPERLGSKKKDNQYTRDCQNSGDVIRRPQQFITEKQVVERGYKYNQNTKLFEKVYKDKKGRKIELVALKFEGVNGPVYYTCDPDVNNERMFIGVLSKSNGLLPCCFKKNQLYSNNYIIKQKFLEALGLKTEDKQEEKNKDSHILYIKNYSNKITNERLYFLPEILDTFFNVVNQKEIKKSSKLELAENGYYLLFGVNPLEYKFLHAISHAVGQTVNQIKNNVIQKLKKEENLFIAVNEGEIANSFKTRKNFINFIENSQQFEFNIAKDFIFYIYNINLLVFEYVPSKNDYSIICVSTIDVSKKFIVLLKEDTNYSIVMEVVKKSKNDKSFEKKILFNNNDPIVKNILEFYSKPCIDYTFKFNIFFYKQFFNIKLQFIDTNNRVTYILTDEKQIFPLFYTGIDPSIPIEKDTEIMKFATTLKEQLQIFSKYEWIEPITLLVKNNKVIFIKCSLKKSGAFIDHELNVPITPIDVSKVKDTQLEFEDYISIKVEYNDTIDERQLEIIKDNIREESYQLFRLELSNFLSSNEHPINLEETISREDKKKKIKNYLFKIVGKFVRKSDLNSAEWFKKHDKEVMEYQVSNIRSLCSENVKTIHCYKSMLNLPSDWFDEFIERVSVDMADDNISGKEILRQDKFFVSDIVDNLSFTFRNNQIILRGNDFSLQKVIDELYGDGVLPNLGKKKKIEVVGEEEEVKLVEYDNYFSQKIVNNNNTILRALVNGFYYLLNKKKYSIELINLKYKSTLQTNLVNYFKGKILNWLRTFAILYKQALPKELNLIVNDDLLIQIHKSFLNDKFWLLFVWCFHKLIDIDITVLDVNNKVFCLVKGGKIFREGKAENSIVLRISFNTFNGFPAEVEVIYEKEK